MNEVIFKRLIVGAAAVFVAVYLLYSLPAAIDMAVMDVIYAGFVNPIASGYSVDALCSWFIFVCWVLFERQQYGIKWGWVCILIATVPGIALGFCVYLIVRQKQMSTKLVQV